MLFLVTGQPGHRKSAQGIIMGQGYGKAGRVVYTAGLRKPNYEALGFLPIPDPKEWNAVDFDATGGECTCDGGVSDVLEREGIRRYLPKRTASEVDVENPVWREEYNKGRPHAHVYPDGSVFLFDEVYNDFPKRPSGQAIPRHVKDLATHRHRGLDFIFVCQKLDQLDSFLHGFVEQHIHVVKKIGHSQLRRFPRATTNPFKTCADVVAFRPSASVFEMYESTTIDTSKMRVPAWWWWAGGLGLVTAAAVAYATHSTKVAVTGGKPQGLPLVAAQGGGKAVEKVLSPEEYVAQYQPRIAGKPWTAPAYDGLGGGAAPDLYCMASDVSCTCITEQGTRYRLDFKLCRTIAREGNYNPTRRAVTERTPPEWVPPPAPPAAESVLGDSFDKPLVIPGAVPVP